MRDGGREVGSHLTVSEADLSFFPSHLSVKITRKGGCQLRLGGGGEGGGGNGRKGRTKRKEEEEKQKYKGKKAGRIEGDTRIGRKGGRKKKRRARDGEISEARRRRKELRNIFVRGEKWVRGRKGESLRHE